MIKNNAILIDWGSTNMRAWLTNDNGNILASHQSEQGVTRISQKDILEVISSLVDKWFSTPDTPVNIIMAGMIGSENGLISVPYLTCPVNINALIPGDSVYGNDKFRIWIIPGVCVDRADNRNVMRGEETLLAGAWSETGQKNYVMPGTHSKWVSLEQGNITDFHTVMTGEMFHLLMNHSLVGSKLPAQQEDIHVFTEGVIKGLTNPRIISSFFEIRAAYILGHLPKAQAGEFVSGLLIGSEIQQMKELYPIKSNEKIVIIADKPLEQRYSAAFNLAGIPWQTMGASEAFFGGMRRMRDVLAK